VAFDYGVRMFLVRVDILDDIGAGTVRLVLLIVLGGFHVVVHGVLHVAIDFLGRTLHLVDDALISELLIADSFPNPLLDFSLDLIEFPAYLIGIHDYIPFCEYNGEQSRR
jgi:hypothetical protein